MLPWSNPNAGPNDNKYRYADTCIAELITLMMRQGSAPSLMTAKIAGGAQMFQASSNPLSAFNIGERNVDAVKQTLAKHKIRIIAEDPGDNFGRTEYFYVQTGVVEVKTASSRLIVL
jgi:chemotaxis protein CheD